MMRFFFYGTLIAGSGNRMARLVQERLRFVGPGAARGTLHAIADPRGWYPALLRGGGEVRGMIYEAPPDFTAADLARLDAYEDYDPASPAASLYLRVPVMVTPAGTAQAYIYNRLLPAGSRPIPGGDFRAWLAAEGLRAFGE